MMVVDELESPRLDEALGRVQCAMTVLAFNHEVDQTKIIGWSKAFLAKVFEE